MQIVIYLYDFQVNFPFEQLAKKLFAFSETFNCLKTGMSSLIYVVKISGVCTLCGYTLVKGLFGCRTRCLWAKGPVKKKGGGAYL